MSFWSKYPFLRLVLFFSLGILFTKNFGLGLGIYYQTLVACLALYCGLFYFFYNKDFYKINASLGLLACMGIFVLGCIQYENTNFYTPLKNEHEIKLHRCVALEDLHVKKNSKSVLIKITHFFENGAWYESAPLKTRLYLSKFSDKAIRYGDVLLVNAPLKEVEGPKKIGDFDFKKLAHISQIYYNVFAKDDQVRLISSGHGSQSYNFIYKILRYAKATFSKYLPDQSRYAVACALLLGDKYALDSETKKFYSESGTMHVLAVSGLHVGVFYILLMFGLNLFKIRRRYLFIGELLCVSVLWAYAAITGFSASVLRATLMFTIIGLAKIFGRSSNIYNSLGLSAFVILLFDPRMLFDVGFQLSYLAVMGISYLSDEIYNFIKFNLWWVNKLWNFTAISIAAQVVTTPLTLYYFSQFPNYFIIANWLVVPASAFVLHFGLLLLLVGHCPFLAEKIAFILDNIILSINAFLEVLTKMPYHLISDIYLDFVMVPFSYGVLLCLFLFFESKQFAWLLSGFLLIFFRLCVWIIGLLQ